MASPSAVRTSLVVAAITAIATVAGALGGTYLGSRTTLEAQREQLRHGDARHQYDLKSAAYIKANQAIDAYFAHAVDPSYSRTRLAREGLRAGNAVDALDFLASREGRRWPCQHAYDEAERCRQCVGRGGPCPLSTGQHAFRKVSGCRQARSRAHSHSLNDLIADVDRKPARRKPPSVLVSPGGGSPAGGPLPISSVGGRPADWGSCRCCPIAIVHGHRRRAARRASVSWAWDVTPPVSPPTSRLPAFADAALR